jgi:translation initiation factor 1
MSKKNKNDGGFIYSTNPEFEFQGESNSKEDIPASDQKLRIYLDRLKGNKEATVVGGFVGNEASMEALGKLLKSKCGVGGTVKNGEIMIQGNHRDKVVEILLNEGYSNTKKAGG